MEKFQQRDFLECYRRNGFVLLKNVVDQKQIDHFEVDLLKLCSKQEAYGNSIEQSLKDLYKKSKERYSQTLRALSKSLSLSNLFMGTELLDAIKQLGIDCPSFPTHPVTHATCLDMIFEGQDLGIKAHQDWPSIQGSLDSLVVWIPLQNIDFDCHPLQVLPRSHKSGMRHGTIDSTGYIIDVSREEDQFEDIVCNRGDAVVFSTFLVHRTKAVSTARNFRLAASLRFDNMFEESFIERNFPCAYKRSVQRSIDFIPTSADLKNFVEKDR